MSLTGFLKQTDVKAEFCRRFPLSLQPDSRMSRVPRVHNSDPALVGTASDWLIRTILLRHHVGCGSQNWLDGEIIRRISWSCPDKLPRTKQICQEFGSAFSDFLRKPEVTRKYAAAAVGMATLERVYRGTDPGGGLIGRFSESDIDDTLSLCRDFRPSAFEFVEEYHLNPNFGEASVAIGGADADLVVRSRTGVWGLVDFKSTRYPGPKEDDYHQLLGYAILNEWAECFPSLTSGCTYFTRTNRFLKYDLEALFRMGDYAAFMDWFRARISTYSRGNILGTIILRKPGIMTPG